MNNTENQTQQLISQILRILWIIPLLILMGHALYLSTWRQSAQTVVVSIDGYDPRSILSGHYIEYTINWQDTDCWQFDGGYCPHDDFRKVSKRYYLPQAEATQIDRLRRIQSDNLNFDIVFSYQKGKTPMARQLLINGLDWQDYLNKN